MEIKFELEDCDIDCVFEPDFRVQQQNTADHSAVSWGLPSTGTTLNVGVLCDEFQAEESIYSPLFGGPNVRLLP
jgi:hypothetical protein